jgi:HEAT repeat protein
MTTRCTAVIRAGLTAAVAIFLAGLALPAEGADQEGDRRSWALDFRARLEQPGGGQPVEIRIEGDLISTIAATRPGEYDAAIEISRAHVDGDAGTTAAKDAIEGLEYRLERRFWATYRTDGMLLSLHFFRDVSPADRNLLQAVLTETQFVRPEPAEPVWTMTERDGAGSYLAIYQPAPGNAIIKRKLKYLDPPEPVGASAGMLRVALDRSETRFRFDAAGGIAGVDGSNEVRIGVAVENGEQLSARTEVHLSNLRRSRAPELIGSLAATTPGVETLPVETHRTDPEVARRKRDAQLLEGHSTESLLEAAFSGAKDEDLADRLAALFRRRPEAAQAALVLLRAHGRQTRVTDALGRSGSPPAVEALGRLARDKSVAAQLRVDAIVGLAMSERASLEAMHIAAGMLDDADARVASAARMMAGALARSGRGEHAAEAKAIDTALIARYKAASEQSDLSSLLAGLGNSASPAAAETIEQALGDSRPAVRAAAVRALRLAAGGEVDGLLSHAMESDADANVRASAIFAAGFHHPFDSSLGRAVIRAARNDASDSVRSSAVALLGRARNKTPEISETLASIAANDVKPGIRHQAQEALGMSARSPQ